jgi:sugar phosphate isomerase/epimerase
MSKIVRAPERNLVHRGVGRVEFHDLNEEAMDGLRSTLDELADEGRRRFSFHAPVIRPDYYPFPAVFQFFLNEDEEKRQLNFRALGDTLERARDWGADYVVTHLTFGGGDTDDRAAAERLAEDACGRIAGMSGAAGVPVDIEFAAYTDSFHQPGQFVAALAPHAELGICLDIGHAFIGASIRGRDYWADLEVLAGRARSVHLWNTKGPEHFKQDPHTPLHPSQRPGDGWIDVGRSLRVLLNGGAVNNIIFEYPVETVTGRIREGYDWVADMIESV